MNGFPYLGKDIHCPPNQSLSENIVFKLMYPYLGKERNVTTDDFFFTSVKLEKNLANKKTSIFSTLNCIRTEVP